MIKAGRRLDNMISDDTGHYRMHLKQITKLSEKNEKILQNKRKKRASLLTQLTSTRIQIQPPPQIQAPPVPNFAPTLQFTIPQSQIRPPTQSKNDSKSNLLNLKDLSNMKSRGVSGVQINKFNEIVKESKNLPGFIANYLKSPVFDKNLELEKFKNLKQYYNEKFKLMSKYLSEEDLNRFISKSSEIQAAKNANSQILNPKNQEDNENLEILKFLEKEEERSESRIKKILKINNEIQIRLLQEDHAYKLQQLQELRLQQNRQLFKLIDELPHKFQNSDDQFLFLHRRPETSEDGLKKRNFLRYKPPKTQQSMRKSSKMENFKAYNPNIDPKNFLFENLFNKSPTVGTSNLNVNNIQNSYIDKERENGGLARACTSDAKYRSLKAEDCKTSFYSNMFFFRKEPDAAILVNKEKNNYKNFPIVPEKNKIMKVSRKNMKDDEILSEELKTKGKDEKVLKPTKKKEEQEILEETRITLEKWKSLPDSLRNLILLRNNENPSEIKEVDMPKYLTKFNKTKYKLRKQQNNEEITKSDRKKEEISNDILKNNLGLTGVGIMDGDLRRDYGAYKGDQGMNPWMDGNDKMNIFNYIDSREWSNNF